jgi:hypothetical protein
LSLAVNAFRSARALQAVHIGAPRTISVGTCNPRVDASSSFTRIGSRVRTTLSLSLCTLPAEVRRRTVKGYSFSFYHHVLQSKLAFVRESLLDGLLVREGILDRQNVDEYLVPEQTFRTVPAVQILNYLSAEGWLRQWASVARERARLIPT